MIPRLRPLASVLAALALLVSWTVGAWAAPCPEVTGGAAVERAMPMEHGAGHHHPDAAHHAPAPADEGGRAPVPDAPECPMLAVGGSCAGPLLAPAGTAAADAAAAPRTAYVAAPDVHDRLLPASLFRPPELG